MFLPSQEKQTVFIVLQAENFFCHIIFKPEVCKCLVILFYHMTPSPMPSSIWYLQWRVQLSPSVFDSVLSATSWPFACILCNFLEAGTVYIIFCTVYIIFCTQMWPKNQLSRVPREVEHQETLFVMLYLKKSAFIVFSLIQHDFVRTVPMKSPVLLPTQMWP